MHTIERIIFIIRESIDAAIRTLRMNKTRTFLATIGIVMGVTTVSTMLAIIQGLNRAFAEQFRYVGSAVLYIQKWPWVVTDDWWIYWNRKELTYENYLFLSERSELAEAITVMNGFQHQVRGIYGALSGVTILGVDEKYLQVRGGDIESGRFITFEDNRSARRVAVIGQDVREELFGLFDPIGREIKIGNIPFTIIGLLEKQGKSFGYSLDKIVLVPYHSSHRFVGKRPGITIAASAYENTNLDDLESELTGLMRISRKLKPQQENDFSINRQTALEQFYTSITSGVYTAGTLIAAISLLVGGIGIMNIMLVSVTERTNEIGIRKAIGAKRNYILLQFLLEASLLCAIGGIFGLGISYVISALIKSVLPTSIPFWLAFGSILFSSIVGIVFGFYPAARASKLNPIDALRYEG
ncbi:MAG: ABC transporter permease [bacterium]|nr:ABC transporter permease [bacterium]